MAIEVNNSDVQTTANTNITVVTDARRLDGTTNNGRISTTFASSGEGDDMLMRLSVSDSSYPPNDDNKGCAELMEYAKDMRDHWQTVVNIIEKFQGENPYTPPSEEDEGGETDGGEG